MRETIRAEREVIVSAGAYQSPVLLMLSGIGLEEELAPFGIAVREQLPVGRNLQDHFMANLNYLSTEPALFGIFTPENFELLHSEGRGPLTSNLPEAGGFFRTRPDLPAPDVELHFSPSLFYDEGLTAPHDHGYVFGPVLVKPVARGTVTLRTPMVDSKPCVLSNFLTTEEDRATLHRRHADRARDRGAAGAQGGRAGAVQRAGLRLGRGHPRVGTPRRPARLPPDLDVRDGVRRRLRATRLRRRGAPGRRRVGDADDHALEHARRRR